MIPHHFSMYICIWFGLDWRKTPIFSVFGEKLQLGRTASELGRSGGKFASELGRKVVSRWSLTFRSCPFRSLGLAYLVRSRDLRSFPFRSYDLKLFTWVRPLNH